MKREFISTLLFALMIMLWAGSDYLLYNNPLNLILIAFVLFFCISTTIVQFYNIKKYYLPLTLTFVLLSGLPLVYVLLFEPVYVSTFPFLLLAVFFVMSTLGLILYYSKRSNSNFKENETED